MIFDDKAYVLCELKLNNSKNLVLFKGNFYEKPSLKDLKTLKNMLDNTIENYQEIDSIIKDENALISDEISKGNYTIKNDKK